MCFAMGANHDYAAQQNGTPLGCTMSALRIPKVREWEWIPHLLTCYVALGLLWFIAGATLFILFGGDTEASLFGANTSGVTARLPFAAYALGLPVVVIPLVLVAATLRVIMNEQRWRRENDPRGR